MIFAEIFAESARRARRSHSPPSLSQYHIYSPDYRYAPPYWVKGEDSAFGFFVHVSPFAKLTPLHWGWKVVHDGWVRAEYSPRYSPRYAG